MSEPLRELLRIATVRAKVLTLIVFLTQIVTQISVDGLQWVDIDNVTTATVECQTFCWSWHNGTFWTSDFNDFGTYCSLATLPLLISYRYCRLSRQYTNVGLVHGSYM